MKRNPTMRRYLQALEPKSNGEAEWHLSHDEFSRLTQATEGDENVAPLREHLLHCIICVEQFKRHHAFYAPPTPTELVPSEQDIARAWDAFTPYLPKPNHEATTQTTPQVSWWQSIFAPRLGWALALLLLAAAGLSFWWALRLRNEKQILATNLEQERNRYITGFNGNTQTQETPTPAQTREEVSVTLPRRGASFTFTIPATKLPSFPTYRAELVNPEGRAVWRGPGLLRDKEGKFRFTFPRSMVMSGAYLMRFYAPEGVGPLAEYTVNING